MMTAACIVDEAFRLTPEASAMAPGKDGSPSRFARTLERLLESAKGRWEERGAGRRDAGRGKGFRGVFAFDGGEVLAYGDNRVVVARSQDQVVRLADGTFAGVWSDGDLGSLCDLLAQAVEGEAIPLEQAVMSMRTIGVRVQDTGHGALLESHLTGQALLVHADGTHHSLEAAESAQEWARETAGRFEALSEADLLEEMACDPELVALCQAAMDKARDRRSRLRRIYLPESGSA